MKLRRPRFFLLATTLWSFIAGCGFASQPSTDGEKVGSGVAPWTDLGPVLICFGNEFIGPPTTTPGGMCADRNIVPTQCLDDSNCRSRESCVCGSCTVQYCTSNSDCGENRLCSFAEKRCDRQCARDDDCPLADVCFNGACRGLCESDSECQTGEVCNSVNRCITVSCADDGDCIDSERCRVQRVPRLAREAVVLARGPSGTSREPRFTMWLELSDELQQDRRAIWRATSADGIAFQVDPARPVIEDDGAAKAPSVVRTDRGFELYYEQGDGAAIRYAVASDGINFGSPATVLAGGAGAAAVHAPSAVALPDNRVALYYESGDGALIAVSQGILGQMLPAGSIALELDDVRDPPTDDTPAPQFWLEIEALRSPFAALVTGPGGASSLRLWFSAYGRESGDSFQFGEVIPIAPSYSIGHAAAAPETPELMVPWSYNPVLDRVQVFVDHRSELSPAAVRVTDPDGSPRDGFLLYYLDAVADGPRGNLEVGRIGVAGNGDFRIRR